MADLIYHVPDPPKRPFKKGDAVIVVDSGGKSVGRQTIANTTAKTVTTDCGRQWTADGWRWDSERRWPFPTIKHARR